MLSKNIIGIILILLSLAFLYSAISGSLKEVQQISLSELVTKINADQVEKIIVRDSDLDITLKDGAETGSKKENEAALSETLKNYGVSDEKLGKVIIDCPKVNAWIFAREGYLSR